MTLDSNAVVVILTTIVIPVATWFIGLCVRGWKAFTILSKLATEFQPNGGSSLKDRIEAIYDEIKELSATNAVSLNLVPYAFFRADVSGNVTWINRYFVQITDLSEQDAFGLGWLNCVCESDRVRVKHEWIAAIADQRSVKTSFKLVDGRQASIESMPTISKKFGMTGLVAALRIEGAKDA
jgi:PAS domain-containing protein